MFVGIVSLLLALFTVLPWFIVNGARIVSPMLWVGIPLASYGLFMLFQGAWQLHRTLNPRSTKSVTGATEPVFKSSITTTALPPAPISVTEVTTNLLSHDARQKEAIPRKDRNTSGLDSDQLM
jgi:hypothetical protein